MSPGVQGSHARRLAGGRVQNSHEALRPRDSLLRAGRLAVSPGRLLAAISFRRSRTLKDLLTLTDLTPA